MPTETKANKNPRASLAASLMPKFKLSILDFYILGEVVSPFFGAVFFMVFVLLMFQVLRLADFFIVHQIPGGLILRMTGLLVLTYTPFVLPISVLVSTLIAFGRISADSELVAMKSVGISIHRVTLPVGLFATAVTLLSLVLNLEWVPWSELKFKETLVRVANTKVTSAIRPGTFTTGFFDMLIYAGEVDKETNQLRKIFIYKEDPKNPQIIIAKQGDVVPFEASTELGSAAMLRLMNGSTHSNVEGADNYQKFEFSEQVVTMEILEGDTSTELKPRMVPYQELLKRIDKYDPTSYDYRLHSTELWRRYSLAMTALIFVLVGVGFGTIRTRTVRSGAIVITFLVMFLYWFLLLGALKISHDGTLPPYVALQIPNLLLVVAGVWGYRKAMW